MLQIEPNRYWKYPGLSSIVAYLLECDPYFTEEDLSHSFSSSVSLPSLHPLQAHVRGRKCSFLCSIEFSALTCKGYGSLGKFNSRMTLLYVFSCVCNTVGRLKRSVNI